MLKGKKIAFGITGSFHKIDESIKKIEEISAHNIHVVAALSTSICHNKSLVDKLERITNNEVITSINQAEKYGPNQFFDIMIISPLTGNSMSKLANGITDNGLLMLAKSIMRNQKPIVLAVSTNDALGLNGVNLMKLLSYKNMYFVPFGQDNPIEKPNSLVSNMNKLNKTVISALHGKQIQPLLLGNRCSKSKNNKVDSQEVLK